MGHYDGELAALPDETKASFLGDNLAECFARMGDPISAGRSEATRERRGLAG